MLLYAVEDFFFLAFGVSSFVCFNLLTRSLGYFADWNRTRVCPLFRLSRGGDGEAPSG